MVSVITEKRKKQKRRFFWRAEIISTLILFKFWILDNDILVHTCILFYWLTVLAGAYIRPRSSVSCSNHNCDQTHLLIFNSFMPLRPHYWRDCQFTLAAHQLVAPPYKLSTIGSRTFKVAAAQTWNNLQDMISSQILNLSFFVWRKTHLPFLSWISLVIGQ